MSQHVWSFVFGMLAGWLIVRTLERRRLAAEKRRWQDGMKTLGADKLADDVERWQEELAKGPQSVTLSEGRKKR